MNKNRGESGQFAGETMLTLSRVEQHRANADNWGLVKAKCLARFGPKVGEALANGIMVLVSENLGSLDIDSEGFLALKILSHLSAPGDILPVEVLAAIDLPKRDRLHGDGDGFFYELVVLSMLAEAGWTEQRTAEFMDQIEADKLKWSVISVKLALEVSDGN